MRHKIAIATAFACLLLAGAAQAADHQVQMLNKGEKGAMVSITTESGPGFFAQKGPRFRVLKGPAGEHPIGRSWSGLHSLIGCG